MLLDPTPGYRNFAYAYDLALGRRFFESLRPQLDRLLLKYPTADRTHLDVACGSGLIVEDFTRRGFRSTGLDISLPMLSIARTRAPRVIAADMRHPPFRTTFSRITCFYDSLNHLLSFDDLRLALNAISTLMSPTSLVWLDVNHPEVYPRVWGLLDPFVSAGAAHELTLDTTFSRASRIGIARIRGWSLVHGQRVAIDETQMQRAHSQAELTEALQIAGLATVEMNDFDPFGERSGRVKLLVVARLKKK